MSIAIFADPKFLYVLIRCSQRLLQVPDIKLAVESVALLPRNWEFSPSNLGPDVGCPDWGVESHPLFLELNVRVLDLSQKGPQTLPSTPFQIIFHSPTYHSMCY